MKRKNGFTLVEILAVVAIIGILALITIPNFIKLFNTSGEGAMKTQENQLMDASKLYLEDNCIHPIYGRVCPDEYSDYNNPIKYACLNTLQSQGYMDKITFKGNECHGFVIFEKEANSKQYNNFKPYLECGSAYQTKGYDEYKDSNGNYFIELCDGNVIS